MRRHDEMMIVPFEGNDNAPRRAEARRQGRSSCPTVVALLCLAAAMPVRAQNAAAGFTIHSETRVVLVDAVAVDKKGKFNRDLTEKDFKIWEDGKEQKIDSFTLESSGVNPERPGKHYIAMLFDSSSGQASQITAHQAAASFVDGFASPDRYMAITNYNPDGELHIAQNFTTDRDRLRKALDQVPGARARPAADRLPRNANADQSADTSTYRNMLASLRDLANSLASIRGRKALIFFTNGIPSSDEVLAEMRATINACNKANVAVYTISSGSGGGGFSASAPSTSQARGFGRGASANVDVPAASPNLTRSLAEDTGGVAFLNANNLANSLGDVAQEQDQYYLLAYTPTVDSAEGSCHDLRVKVDRGDLEVRARKSYCTSKPADALSGKPAGQDLEARAAGNTSGNMKAAMQLPWFYSTPNIARVDLAMDLVPSAVKFQKEKGKLHGELDLAGVAYRADGSVAARVSDAVQLEFDSQQEADEFVKTPYYYQKQFDIAPGQYTFRMAFSSDGSGANGFGKVEMPLAIDPWDGQTLSLSGVALSHEAHPAVGLADELDVSLLQGARPLISRGTEAVPTGTARFHADEQGYFYCEAYEPMLSAAKADAQLPVVGLRVRVLNRSTGEQKQDTGYRSVDIYERAGNPVIPILVPLPVANLAAGGYRLEVSVVRKTGAPVVRTADFDIH